MAKETRLGTDPLQWIQDSRQMRQSSVHRVYQVNRVYTNKPQNGGTRRNPRVITTASQEGLPDGWIRATFIVQEDQLAQIKALAYWERKQIKEVITEALSAYLAGRHVEPLPEHRG